MRAALALSLVLALLFPLISSANTWHVRQNGTGDYSVIQDAVDAATDGDTIIIGPGRYEEYHTVYANGLSAEVYVDLLGKSLTLIGAGMDQTFIGPEDQDFHPWPGEDVFIVLGMGCPELIMSQITLDHSPWKLLGLSMVGTLNISECQFKEGNRGITGQVTGSGIISNCHFEELSSNGVGISDPTPNCLVENCTFINTFAPVEGNWSPAKCDVVNCQMDGGRVAVGFYGGAGGSVINCTIRDFEYYGVAISDGGEVVVIDNTIEQTEGWGMTLNFAGNCTIRQNTISTQTGTCLFLPYPCDGMVFEGNDLYRGSGEFAKTSEYWPYPARYFHLENNYWGTTDAEEIQAHIFDGNDYESSDLFVIFEPFAGGSVPTSHTTLDHLKAMYR